MAFGIKLLLMEHMMKKTIDMEIIKRHLIPHGLLSYFSQKLKCMRNHRGENQTVTCKSQGQTIETVGIYSMYIYIYKQHFHKTLTTTTKKVTCRFDDMTIFKTQIYPAHRL